MKIFMIVMTASLTIGLTVAANLLLKRGSSESASSLLLGLIGWRTLGGFFAFGLALIAYTMLLKYVPLHFAASVTSAKFIGVVLAAAFLLQERVHSQQWTGMALIAIGILVVSLSPRLPEQQPSPDQSLEQEHSGLEKPTLNKGT